MADNYTFKDAAGNVKTHASKDIGGGVHASEHVLVDAAGVEVAKAEDAAHSSGDSGIMALAVRKDTAAALADSDGDYTPLVTDASGRLHVTDSGASPLLGSVTETAPASDTASSGLNGRLQRIAQRLTSLIASLPASIGQKNAAGSVSVVLASDHGVIATSPASPGTIIHKQLASTSQLNNDVIWTPASGNINLTHIVASAAGDVAISLRSLEPDAASYIAELIGDGAKHIWLLNEASAAAIVDEGDTGGLDGGTDVGAPTYKSGADIITSYAVTFDGNDGIYQAATKPASTTTGAMEAWIYPTSAPSVTGVIFGMRATGNTTLQMYMQLSSALKPTFRMYDSGGTLRLSADANAAISLNEWHHIVWQHIDGTDLGLQLFVDGAAAAFTYNTGSDSTDYWYDDLYSVATEMNFGMQRKDVPTAFFIGQIALCAWYEATSPESVWNDHYALGLGVGSEIVWGPHYFGERTGASVPFSSALEIAGGAPLAVTTDAAVGVCVDLYGYEAA